MEAQTKTRIEGKEKIKQKPLDEKNKTEKERKDIKGSLTGNYQPKKKGETRKELDENRKK